MFPADFSSQRPLGLSENVFPDSAFSASSTLNSFPSSVVFPGGARMDNINTWWQPTAADLTPSIQIDLGIDYQISAFALQGSAVANHWVTALNVDYQNNAAAGTGVWTALGAFAGTTAANTTTFRAFPSSVRGRIFRFSPTASVGAAAMRFELFGRHWLAPALGMNPVAVLTLPDSAISASSEFVADGFSYPVGQARLGNAYVGWSAASTTAANEWLQIDLGTPTNLQGITVDTHKAPLAWWIQTYNVLTSYVHATLFCCSAVLLFCCSADPDSFLCWWWWWWWCAVQS